MATVESFLSLEEVAPGDKERYYIVVSKTGYVSDDGNGGYFTANGAACLPTFGIESTEIINDFLEDYCGEKAEEQGFFDPLVFYGEICNPATLEDEPMDDYFLFVPEHDGGNYLIGYNLYTISGIEELISMIESVMKELVDLEIEDLIIFRGEEIPLSMQVSQTFDQEDADKMLGEYNV